MRKNILTISTFIALTSAVVYGQQEKLLTHFIYDKMTINPASTGLDDGFSATSVYRNQWDKINGAPNSVLLNLEANMNRFMPGGLGMSFYHDAIGKMRQNSLLFNYSLPLRIPGAGTLAVGVGLGMVNIGFDPNWIPPVTYQDPSLPTQTAGTNVDFNAGLMWKGDQEYYVGVSATHLTQADIKNVNYANARNLFVIAGKMLHIDGQGIGSYGKRIDVQMLMRSDMVKFSTELNVRYLHNTLFYAGATYRISDGAGLMIGYHPIPRMTIGYSYDLTLNKLRDISQGSHEIVLKYVYMLPPPPVQKSKHPRWL